MTSRLRPLVLGGLVSLLAAPAFATDFLFNGTGFPIAPIPGNPVLTTGDRLVGTYLDDEYSTGYATFAGTGSFGLNRYTFTLDAGTTPTFLDLYDTAPDANNPFLFSDFFDRRNTVTFDMFDTGADQVFGFGIDPDGGTANFNLSWERTSVPVLDIGQLNNNDTFAVLDLSTTGAGTWFSFSLAETMNVFLDTNGSEIGDTEIALFTSLGETIAADDDDGPGFTSFLGQPLVAGTYYVAIGEFDSRYNWDTFGDTPIGWSRNGFSGANTPPGTITLGILATTAPEPATAGLLGIGLLATGVVRRKRRATHGT